MNIFGRVIHFIRGGIGTFIDRDGLTLAAAISFYTALSVSPLLVLVLWIAHESGATDQAGFLEQVQSYAGPQIEQFVKSILNQTAREPNAGDIAGVLGIATLLISAGGIFGQLQSAMNRVWKTDAASLSVLLWLRRRLVSIAMVFALGVTCVVSVIATSLVTWFGAHLPQHQILAVAIECTNVVMSFLVFSLFFCVLFKFLPDEWLGWKEAWQGGLTTATLFMIGKSVIGLYIGYSGVSSAYGAAGSFAVFLVWVYYSAAIFLFGAALTRRLTVDKDGPKFATAVA